MMVTEKGHNICIEGERNGRRRIPKVRHTMDLVVQGVYLFIFFFYFYFFFIFLILLWEEKR